MPLPDEPPDADLPPDPQDQEALPSTDAPTRDAGDRRAEDPVTEGESPEDLAALLTSLPRYKHTSAAMKLRLRSRNFRVYRERDLPAGAKEPLTLCPYCGGDTITAGRPRTCTLVRLGDDADQEWHATLGPGRPPDGEWLVVAEPPPTREELRARANRRLARWELDTGQHLNGHRAAYVDAWGELTGDGVADSLLCEVLSGLGRYLHDKRGPGYLRDRARNRTTPTSVPARRSQMPSAWT